MASGPITSWQIDGETVETASDFIFWGSKIPADGDYSHGIKRPLLLGRKVMTNLDSIFKGRDITYLRYTDHWLPDLVGRCAEDHRDIPGKLRPLRKEDQIGRAHV